MPVDEKKLYSEFNTQLGDIANGVALHAADVNFPPAIKETDIRSWKDDLEVKREAYDKASSVVDNLKSIYDIAFKDYQAKFSSVCTSLYGFHGKQNPIVADYGLKTYKKKGKTGPRKKKEE
ncbi:MAG: hypothetical protein WCS69_13520 [Ignavibacteriaceae bacterium]|jgi:hypothetical protein